MNRFQSQMVYGALVVVTGVLLANLSFSFERDLQYVLAGEMLAVAVFSFITAGRTRKSEITSKYNAMQGAGMLAFATIIILYVMEVTWFVTITMCFLLYFGIVELFFGVELLAYKITANIIIVLVGMLTGFFLSICAIIVLNTSVSEDLVSLLMAGILFALKGGSFILLSIMSRKIGYPY